jgi:hypothetical protein
MPNGMPDPVRFMKVFHQVIVTAAKATKAKDPPVAICGECVYLLCAQADVDGHSDGKTRQSLDPGIRRGYSLRVFSAPRCWTLIFSSESVKSTQPCIP